MSALWELCRPFWGGWRSWRAWSLLAVAVSMGFGIVYLNVQINEWSRVFYDTLGTYDSSKLFGLMKDYTVYILLYIGVFVYQDWFTSLLVGGIVLPAPTAQGCQRHAAHPGTGWPSPAR